MRREIGFAILPLALAVVATAQLLAQPAPAAPSGAATVAPAPVPRTWKTSTPSHCKVIDGKVLLSAVIDAHGVAREIETIRSSDPDLTDVAENLLATEKFTPGTINGAPAEIAIQDEFTLKTCDKRYKTYYDGTPSGEVRLRAQPEQTIRLALAAGSSVSATPVTTDAAPAPYRVGGNISAPVLLKSVAAEYTAEARKKQIAGVCLVKAIVDANGIPQNVQVIESIDPGLDRNAVVAVEQYRFKPALKDGVTPVPVAINIEVNFELYNNPR